MKARARFLSLAGIFLTAKGALWATDLSGVYTLDLPVAADKALPTWLGRPATSGGTFAELDVPIDPPAPDSALLVTVFFREANGGFLRISWQDATVPLSSEMLPGPGEVGASSVLSDNFYEGIGMNNQRSLLINADVMKHAGTLHFQAGGANLDISRIQMEWLGRSAGLTSPAITDTLVTSASGTTQLASTLAGTPALAGESAWHDRIVDISVVDAPLRIDSGVDFTVVLDGQPVRARVSLKETGLSPGKHLVVWLNNKRAGIVMPVVPSLSDAGYVAGSTDAPYVGWREGSVLLPVAALASGNNILQFSVESDSISNSATDASADTNPLAVKDVDFQLEYPASHPAAVTSSASASPTPPLPPLVTNSAPVAPGEPAIQLPAPLPSPQ